MSDIYLVSCTRRKLKRRAAASDLYTSPLFRKSRNLVRLAKPRKWFILSAKHGLLAPEMLIDPYDVSLAETPPSSRKAWAEGVVLRLKGELTSESRVVILANDLYCQDLLPVLSRFGIRFLAPLRAKSDDSSIQWIDGVLGKSRRGKDLDTLYELIDKLDRGTSGKRPLETCIGSMKWPNGGVYLLFEESQSRVIGPSTLRVVRVGTHGVSAGSKSTLWTRLRTHRGTSGGGGNHRSSILRLHVGAAMLQKHADRLSSLSWGIGQNASATIRKEEATLENLVSGFIGKMRVLWLSISDAPSAYSDRAYVEQNLIALLAGRLGPIDLADSSWLGTYSPRPEIRSSALWNVDFVNDDYDPRFLDIFEQYVDITLSGAWGSTRSLAPRNWHTRKREVGGSWQLQLFENDSQ